MITLRAVERYWQNGEYAKLLGDLSAARPEAGVARMLQSTSPKSASAALALIRLEELGQELVVATSGAEALRHLLRVEQGVDPPGSFQTHGRHHTPAAPGAGVPG